MLTLVRAGAAPARLHRRGDRRRRPAGHHHVHPQGDGRGRRRASTQAGPKASATSSCTSAVATRRARHRRAARLLRRPGLPASRQINWADGRRHGRLDVQAVRARGRRINDGYSLEDTFDGNSPYVFPDGLEVRNEGTGADGTDYGSAVTLTYATEESINTAFVDMSDSRWRTGPQKILDMANKMGIPPAKPDPHYPGIPSSTRDLEPDALITLGKAADQPDQHGQRLRHHRQRRPARRRARHREGRRRSDGETRSTSASRTPRRAIDPDIDRRRQLRAAAGRAERHRHATPRRSAARPPARPARRPTAGDQVVLVVVRRLHAPAGHGRDVRPRRRQRPARRQLAAALQRRAGYFGADYPTATWTAVMKRDLDGSSRSRSSRRRPTSPRQAGRPRAGPPTYTAAAHAAPARRRAATDAARRSAERPRPADDRAPRRPSAPPPHRRAPPTSSAAADADAARRPPTTPATARRRRRAAVAGRRCREPWW